MPTILADVRTMVAIDTTTGVPVRIGGAALSSGPALGPRGEQAAATSGVPRIFGVSGAVLPGLPSLAGLGGATGPGARRAASFSPWAPAIQAADPEDPAALLVAARAAQKDALPTLWGASADAYAASALFGPPYALPDAMIEWQLSAATAREFRQSDRAARMALRLHPRPSESASAGTHLSALYGLIPAPLYLGVGIDYGV